MPPTANGGGDCGVAFLSPAAACGRCSLRHSQPGTWEAARGRRGPAALPWFRSLTPFPAPPRGILVCVFLQLPWAEGEQRLQGEDTGHIPGVLARCTPNAQSPAGEWGTTECVTRKPLLERNRQTLE